MCFVRLQTAEHLFLKCSALDKVREEMEQAIEVHSLPASSAWIVHVSPKGEGWKPEFLTLWHSVKELCELSEIQFYLRKGK